mmetsp:Transcript_29145/g.61611  ORF Transcript_29145/g.61611 Transcript_29145/m.61611 type:complete len:500 (+) Transcript_29145:80-1579(+)
MAWAFGTASALRWEGTTATGRAAPRCLRCRERGEREGLPPTLTSVGVQTRQQHLSPRRLVRGGARREAASGKGGGERLRGGSLASWPSRPAAVPSRELAGLNDGPAAVPSRELAGLNDGPPAEGERRGQGMPHKFETSSPSSSSEEEGYKNTLAHRVLDGDVAHHWLKHARTGRLVQPILLQSRRSGSPFGVELELVQGPGTRVFGPRAPEAASQVVERIERDNYHVYYVLSGSGRLKTALGDRRASDGGSSSSAVDLQSGDIFALAPRVRYSIESGAIVAQAAAEEGERANAAAGTPLAMLSITVPVSLTDYRVARAEVNQGMAGAGKANKEEEEEEEESVLPAQIKFRNQEAESCLLSSRLRHAAELLTFQLPNNSKNRIAPVFDPFRDCTPFTCSIEILEPLGVIPRHQHDEAYELFIILSGCVDLYLNGTRKISGKLGDTLLVKPRNDHELINPDTGEKVYMLSIILPNETFAKQVWNGNYSGRLRNADVNHLVD